VASASVTRLYDKLNEMGLQIGHFTPGGAIQGMDLETATDAIADNLYESLVALEKGEVEEVGDFDDSEENDVLKRFRDKYNKADPA
jgi:hypothetical protein